MKNTVGIKIPSSKVPPLPQHPQPQTSTKKRQVNRFAKVNVKKTSPSPFKRGGSKDKEEGVTRKQLVSSRHVHKVEDEKKSLAQNSSFLSGIENAAYVKNSMSQDKLNE